MSKSGNPTGPVVPPEILSDAELLEKYSKNFIGAYSHSLDSKGRLIVPAAFREGLGKTFYIGPSFNFRSIALYPNIVWARTRDNYARLSAYDAKLKLYLEQFDAMSYRDQEMDAQGRILLPYRIRQRILKDERDIEISGAGEYIRLAPAEKSDLDFERFLAEMDDIQEAISNLGQHE